MNCLQFENALSDYLEGARTPEQQAHLSSCSACSDLLDDLNLISTQAVTLRELEDPSPKIWNALEAQLRREGLIRQPARPSLRSTSPFLRWRTSWMVPVAAVLVIFAATKLYQPTKVGDNQQVTIENTNPAVPQNPVSADDRDIMTTVASRTPSQVAAYRNDLAQANAFIRDAEDAVRSNPNDIYSQQMLMNAYEQKQMLFRLAVDQSNDEQ